MIPPRTSFVVLAAVLSLAVLPSCSDSGTKDGGATPEGPGGGKPVVQATNYPLAYFAERIAGDLAEIGFLAPADGDPAFWEPTESDIAALQEADLILFNGATYSKWRNNVSLPESAVIDTSSSFAGEYLKTESGVAHSHGPGGDEHSHAGTAFTTWMDFRQAIWQAEAIRDALVRILPDEKETLDANLEALASDLESLHQEFSGIGEALAKAPLVGSHPVYQYFARRYGLDIEALHWEPEVVPDAEALADLAKLRERHEAGWMIWEGDPAPESVALLEKEGVRSLVVDPCGNRPDSGDWLSVMKQNAGNLRAAAP